MNERIEVAPLGFCDRCLEDVAASGTNGIAKVPGRLFDLPNGIRVFESWCEHNQVGGLIVLTGAGDTAPRWELHVPVDILVWNDFVQAYLTRLADERPRA